MSRAERDSPLRARGSRPTVWDRVGGVRGLVQSAIPSVVFVSVHTLVGMASAVAMAIAAALVVLAVRRCRGVTVRPAIGGVVGVVVSAAVAGGTGDARDYFLPDIWGYTIGSAVLMLSVIVRWPLAGVVWTAMNGSMTTAWRADKRALSGYTVATVAAAIAFAVRALIQTWFYRHDVVGAMTVVRVGLGYPLWGMTALVWAWAIHRADGGR
ncbi:DUF3159 domain-containing protein [Williamsia sterculiae]|uniref:DUF3159 domain-containing protein n=1 Tax=Williamsia sterculiae TaxID=1344003 RepID=UPI000970A3E6|nr:DUF3159 domain-containing protein [Williamsia sterculiae]